jgi:SulP family sulfate permease
LLLQLNQAALDLRVVELVPDGDGQLEERAAPARLASHRATLVDIYGSLHYAGARTLEGHLPDPAGTVSPALVLRMRGRTTLGATSLTVLANYARQLDAVRGRLYLAGLDAGLIEQARRTGAIAENAPVLLYGAEAIVGGSSLEAFRDAQAWADAQRGASS